MKQLAHGNLGTPILAVCFSVMAWAQGGQPTELSGAPWDPALIAGDKVIYGQDDRLDVYQVTDPALLSYAASTCALVDGIDLTQNPNGTYTLTTYAYRYSRLPPCAGEPFANQPTAAFCTGFLVGADLVATAGHCYSAADLSLVRFVFGFDMINATTPRLTFDANQVYQGVAVVGQEWTSVADYTIVRLDRPVTAPGAVPLPIRRSGAVSVGAQVGVIGHPWGLPKKIAFGAQTTVRANDSSNFFHANLDTYGGNSGSPVFNQATGIVEGILVYGAPDFVVRAGCFESNRLEDSQGQEGCTKSTAWSRFVPQTGPCEGPELWASLQDSDIPCAAGASTLSITNVGCETLNWSITTDCAWLTFTETEGSITTGIVDVIVSYGVNNTGQLRCCEITVTAPGAAASPAVFTLCQNPCDLWDPNDDLFTGATQLDAPTATAQSHGPHYLADYDGDWFRLPLESGVRYHFWAEGAGMTYVDFFELFQGAPVVWAYAEPSPQHFDLYFTVFCDNDHLLKVYGEGAYTLYYEVAGALATDDAWDPADDTNFGATVLNAPTETEQTHGPHKSSRNDTFDFFKVTLEAGKTYNFTSAGTGDPVAELYRDSLVSQLCDSNAPNISPVASADDIDAPDNLQFSLTYRPAFSGDYILLVWPYNFAKDTQSGKRLGLAGEKEKKQGGGLVETYTLHYSVTGGGPAPHAPAVEKLRGGIAEETMPLSIEGAPDGQVAPSQPLAIRLTANAPIVPESVAATVNGLSASVTWRPTDTEDGADGWAIVTLDGNTTGDVTVAVTATDVNGAALSPAAWTYVADEAAAKNAADITLIEATDIPPLPELLAPAASPVYRIEPAGVFDTPVPIRIPLPQSLNPGSLAIYYYSESELHPGWYPAENVTGWLAPDSALVVEEDGRRFLEVFVNHAGVLQLGKQLRVNLGGVGITAKGPGAHWVVMSATLLALGVLLARKIAKGRPPAS